MWRSEQPNLPTQRSQVYILENKTLKYGGGICVDSGSIPEVFDVCFYQIVDLNILNNNNTFVYLAKNIAPVTGYEIYAGPVKNCINIAGNSRVQFNMSHVIFSHVFRFKLLNTSLSS